MQIDTRPRFGWCDDIDLDPQHITENKKNKTDVYVAVIALPTHTPKMRKRIRDFCKYLNDLQITNPKL